MLNVDFTPLTMMIVALLFAGALATFAIRRGRRLWRRKRGAPAGGAQRDAEGNHHS